MGKNKRTRLINNQEGMTLVEVMAALVILSLLCVSMLGLYTSSQMWISKAGVRVQASEYAAAIMENIRARSEKLNSVTMTGSPPTATYMDTDISHSAFSLSPLAMVVNDPARFTEQVKISPYSPGEHNLYSVTVTVSWVRGDKNDSYTLTSVVAAR